MSSPESGSVGSAQGELRVERWPSEEPLRALVTVVAVVLWGVGIFWVPVIGIFLLLRQAMRVARVRAGALRIGPDQKPELWARVQDLARRLELSETPVTYVLRTGERRARATRFLGRDLIVLDSDLLASEPERDPAIDFVLARELARIRTGQLRWRWFLLPGILTPVLGTSFSRACELTCDRYAFAIARDRAATLDALLRLETGNPERVDRPRVVAQAKDLETVWMKIGQWLSSSPPLAVRLAALDPALVDPAHVSAVWTAPAALATLAGVIGIPVFLIVWAFATPGPDEGRLRADVEVKLRDLARAAEMYRRQSGTIPQDSDELYAIWSRIHPNEPEPVDPFDGRRYGYLTEDDRYILWSAGPDPEDETDDIEYRSPERVAPPPATPRAEPTGVPEPSSANDPAEPGEPEEPRASTPTSDE